MDNNDSNQKDREIARIIKGRLDQIFSRKSEIEGRIAQTEITDLKLKAELNKHYRDFKLLNERLKRIEESIEGSPHLN